MKSFLTEKVFRNYLKSSGKLPIQSNSGTELSLADLVDVAGEVEHLVGEAPLIGIAFGASLKTTDLQSLLYSGFYAKSLLHL